MDVNLTAVRSTLYNTMMLLCEDIKTAERERLAVDFVDMVLSLLAFHREQASDNARSGVQDVYTHPEDMALPDHWGAKPFTRIAMAEVPAELGAGLRNSRFWAIAGPEHQKGTIAADLAELVPDVQKLYDAAIDDRVNGQRAPSWDHISIDPAVIDRIAGAFGLRQK